MNDLLREEPKKGIDFKVSPDPRGSNYVKHSSIATWKFSSGLEIFVKSTHIFYGNSYLPLCLEIRRN